MKVILLQEVKGKGVEGDVIDVAGGFADNYLLPNKIAVKATKGNLKQLEQRRKNIEKRETERIANAEKLKAALDGATVKVEARVGEEGTLFGSVTSQMIADAVAKQLGVEIDRRLIDAKGVIKTAGEHEAVISLHRDVKANLKLFVGSEETFAAATAAEEAPEEQHEEAPEGQPEEAAEKTAE
ncbi:50S ribosomal protein L9 [Curtanaerobium respiraculi]|uniref:50S ribosomal protein L9 n=1 Tax=Curtanaerobium respiraculi TaxID=2949669 RepID=UPI0024B38D57|nr:50S ribosomal protein L9 [Curtanaerobium respiraculi]